MLQFQISTRLSCRSVNAPALLLICCCMYAALLLLPSCHILPQFLESYKSVTLESMATAFDVGLPFLDTEVSLVTIYDMYHCVHQSHMVLALRCCCCCGCCTRYATNSWWRTSWCHFMWTVPAADSACGTN